MLRELLLAIAMPCCCSCWPCGSGGDALLVWLGRPAQRPSWLWNIGIGLILTLSLLRWPLLR